MDRLLLMEAFVRVVDAGSFSAAARRWGRSKAVVSKYVSALERYLGVQLLARTTRSLRLTDAGRTYHQRCADLLLELESLEGSLREAIAAPRGRLRVTAPPGFASRHLEMMTKDFLTKYPEIRIDLDLTHRMVDLIAEEVDVAIRITDPLDSSLVARRLAPAPIVAVAAPSYLERRGTPKVPRELLSHDCLVDTNFRDQQRWRFRNGAGVTTVSVDGPLRLNDPNATAEMAAAGLGVALVPAFVAEDSLRSGRLLEILQGQVALRWSILAVYPKRRVLPRRVRAYIDHLTEKLGAGTRGASGAPPES